MERQYRRRFAPEMLDDRITPTPLPIGMTAVAAVSGPSIADPNPPRWPYLGTMPDEPVDLGTSGNTQQVPGRPEYFPQPPEPDLLHLLFPTPRFYQLEPNDMPPVDYSWIDNTL